MPFKIWLWVNTKGIPFGVGEFTTHFRTFFSRGLGCSLGVRDFDPWPFGSEIWSDRVLGVGQAMTLLEST